MDDVKFTYNYTIEAKADVIVVREILRILWRATADIMGPDYRTYMGVKVMDILDFLIQAVDEAIVKENKNGKDITDPGSDV